MTGDMVTTGDMHPPAPDADRAPAVEVQVVPDATVAWMVVRPVPPGPPPAQDDAARARATAALARAGVVHGIDAAAVATALAAADGARHVVARATPAHPPMDARIVRPDAAAAQADDLFSVTPGTLLAHRGPARAGTPGTDVLGAPIIPAAPRVPALTAGPGARAVEHDDGTLVVHATAEGRPVWRGAVAAVDDTLRIGDIAAAGPPRHVHGNLRVGGDVGEGAHLSVSGTLTVAGLVTHARVSGERGVHVAGSCVGAHVRAGVRQAAAARLAGPLREGLDELAAVGAGAAQLAAVAAQGSRPLRPTAAVRMLVEHRHPSLPARWSDLAAALGADAAAAGVADDARALVKGVADALGAGAPGTATPEHIAGWCAALAPVADALAAGASGTADIHVGYLQASRVETPGALVVTGAGTYNTDITIGGDLVAEAPGATVRGGALHVAGMVRVAELGAPGGARVAVHLLGPPTAGRRLRAGVAHPGVEVTLAGRTIRIERPTLNLVVGCDEDNRVVHSGDPSA